jgi:KRAB domain-containing zinc finger protein
MHIKEVHEKTDRNKCSVCSSNFSNIGNLKTHMSEVHPGKKLKYACTLCETSFLRKANLDRHVEGVHEGKKPYTCLLCGGSFHQKVALKSHIDSVHDGIKPKPRKRSKTNNYLLTG